MDNGAINRARLWLRTERALGLKLVTAPPQVDAAPAESPAAPQPAQLPAFPRKSPAPAPPSPATNPAPMTISTLPLASPELPTKQKAELLAAMDQTEVRPCTRCRLCQTRTHTVFGEGDPDAKIFFIGEGPGETEDQTGRPFVGRAGELLNKMIAGMGLKREQVFIGNIVKCRPPQNREPAPDEVATCTPYLERQLEIIRPRVIVTLGKPAAHHMLQTNVAISRLRGNWQSWRGIKLMPTFHPAYILRNYTAETRGAVWSDLQQVMTELGMPPSKRGTE